MDSGNSGSMQSSSGGDDDYDSRAESISAFLNNPPFTAGSNPQPPQHGHQFHMLDPLSNYFDPSPNSFQRSPSLSNPNPLLNLDMAWSKPGRSADLGALMPSSSNQAFGSGQLGGQSRGGAFPTAQQNLSQESCSRGLVSVSGVNNDQGPPNTTNTNTVRNPKKRTRAPRRAPTTVLTTDTTNFRAMVQEFTGIPAPPFPSSPFPRARLDLFASPSSSLRSPHFDPPFPPYLLRPFPHKLHSPSPFLSSSSAPMPSFPTTSSMVDPLPSNPATNSPATSINYQLSSDLGLLKQQPPLNVNNMHTPILNFQSILQPPPKFPTQNSSSILAPKSQGSLEIPLSADSHLKMGVLDELGLTHTHANANVVGGLHRSMVPPSSDGAMTGRSNMNNVVGGASYSNAERVTNGIVNYLASSTDNFHGDKGPECVAAVPRSEGMLESWINCSSD